MSNCAAALPYCCGGPQADARLDVNIVVNVAQELPIKSGAAWICLRDFCQWPDTNNTFSFIAK